MGNGDVVSVQQCSLVDRYKSGFLMAFENAIPIGV